MSGNFAASAPPGPREARERGLLRWLVFLGFVFLLPLTKPFLLPVVAALLLSVVLAEPVRALQRRGIREPVGALIVVAALVGVVAGIAVVLAQPASEWMARAPANVDQLMRSLERLRDAIPLLRVTTSTDASGNGGGISGTIASHGWTITRAVLDQVTGLAVAMASTVLLLYFLLASEHFLVVRLMENVPGRRARLHWLSMGRSVQREVGHYISTMTLVNILLGTATGLALWGIGLPNPLLWGSLTAVLNYVPYLGPLVNGSLLFMAGVLHFEDLGLMVAPPLAFFGLNLLEAYVVTPLMMGKRLDLNPVFLFLSVMFWGWAWGIAGALVAVPVLLTIRNLMRHSRRWRHVSYWLEQPVREGGKTIGSLVHADQGWVQRLRWRQRAAPLAAPVVPTGAPPQPALSMPATPSAPTSEETQARSRPEPLTTD